MLTTIEHLSKPQQERLAELIQQIARAVQPEKIICYGIRISQYREWSCFLDTVGCKENVYLSFDLLILSPTDEKRAEHDISQIAEQKCQSPLAISCITHKIHAVNHALTSGSPFFCSLYHKGILLYDAGVTSLSDPGNPEKGALKKYIAEAYWSRWYGLAQQFLKGAAESLSYGRPALTVFMLHQAVEHTCIALIRVFTGYRPNTHNLTRLLAFIENFSELLLSVFPCVTKKEKELFDILVRGYSDTRYKDVYDISADAITILVERVREIQDLAAALYQNRIGFYGQQESNCFPITEHAK